MAINKEIIIDLTKEFGKESSDTGSPATQIAIITERIRNITAHLKNNKKDQTETGKSMKEPSQIIDAHVHVWSADTDRYP